MTAPRMTRWLALSCVLLLVALLVLGVRWRGATDAADRAQDDAEATRRLAAEILGLRQRATAPDAGTAPEAFNLAQAIEAAVARSGAEPGVFERALPQPPRRVPDRPYATQATVVSLRGVTLDQARLILTGVTDAAPAATPMTVTALRLTAPRREDAADATTEPWDIEAVLTQTIHTPGGARS